jgi:hypothetical protein
MGSLAVVPRLFYNGYAALQTNQITFNKRGQSYYNNYTTPKIARSRPAMQH